MTTFGESHCKGVGCIVDGVPANMDLTEADVQPQLTRRRPGQSRLTTPRDEKDQVTIYSGTERGVTLGTPVMMLVNNLNVRPGDYKEMKKVPRPGHADYAYQVKYGNRAASGGGRSSARETIGRVAAGAIAEKWLRDTYGVRIVSWVTSCGTVEMDPAVGLRTDWTRDQIDALGQLRVIRSAAWKQLTMESGEFADKSEMEAAQKTMDADDEAAFVAIGDDGGAGDPAYLSHAGDIYDRHGTKLDVDLTKLQSRITEELVNLRCPDPATGAKMATLIRKVKSDHDSTGGTATCVCTNVPAGLGEPCFDKLEAMLAHGMMSLPATKGFEIGSGFSGTKLRGSQHNDPFKASASNGIGSKRKTMNGKSGASTAKLLATTKNHAGGTLGGISSGQTIVMRIAVKPVSTIGQAQKTATFDGESAVLEAKGRHDPCVLPRVPPLLESMAALVLADAAMIQRSRVARPLPYEGFAQENSQALCTLPPRPDRSAKRPKTASEAEVVDP